MVLFCWFYNPKLQLIILLERQLGLVFQAVGTLVFNNLVNNIYCWFSIPVFLTTGNFHGVNKLLITFQRDLQMLRTGINAYDELLIAISGNYNLQRKRTSRY